MTESIEAIHNFLKLSDHIATAGQPIENQFAAIKEAGYQTVINLAPPGSTNAIPHEKDIVESLGMDYVYIPVIWTNPTIEDLDRFFAVINANAEQPIFVHCAKNMRVSAFMYLYRCLHDRNNDQQAEQDLHRIWIPNETWQAFIQRAIEHYRSA
ncbi:protein tyrosine phosphatase family protein [Phormidesmis priestleyi]|uniref:protein tyrosine phosphatase family protein n=1 Tax=Phormidesmis priestleyi TaxID=268141 RepID=UPI000B133E47|nr:protein tyrosine phosphatase family protein [Phormidesmis priestleyi]